MHKYCTAEVPELTTPSVSAHKGFSKKAQGVRIMSTGTLARLQEKEGEEVRVWDFSRVMKGRFLRIYVSMYPGCDGDENIN